MIASLASDLICISYSYSLCSY